MEGIAVNPKSIAHAVDRWLHVVISTVVEIPAQSIRDLCRIGNVNGRQFQSRKSMAQILRIVARLHILLAKFRFSRGQLSALA